jgi:hypothetical protein
MGVTRRKSEKRWKFVSMDWKTLILISVSLAAVTK